MKAVARLVTGEATTGPGEITFNLYASHQNEIAAELRNLANFQHNLFDWDLYNGTCIADHAKEVLEWGIAALNMEEYARGDYRCKGIGCTLVHFRALLNTAVLHCSIWL